MVANKVEMQLQVPSNRKDMEDVGRGSKQSGEIRQVCDGIFNVQAAQLLDPKSLIRYLSLQADGALKKTPVGGVVVDRIRDRTVAGRNVARSEWAGIPKVCTR